MGFVLSVSKSGKHDFSKIPSDTISLIEGEGIEGDAHSGKTAKHRSLVKADPTQRNLRQVHLIHHELIVELLGRGFSVYPGTMGENITTSGIDLLSLPTGSVLKIGPDAVIEITGLRDPCGQLDDCQPGLMKAVLDHDDNGNLIRKAGIFGIVVKGGVISKNDTVEVELPKKPHRPLEVV